MMLPAEQYPFLSRDLDLGGLNLYPFLPLTLALGERTALVTALLDTAATINVLPYDIGLQIGAVWDEQTTSLQLAGNLAQQEARALKVTGTVGKFPSVPLVFAWTKSNTVPLLLGQMNFFLEFDVCFFRSRAVFEVKPK